MTQKNFLLFLLATSAFISFGQFTQQSGLINEPNALTIHAADINNDGNIDVLTGSAAWTAWHENLGGGNFGSLGNPIAGTAAIDCIVPTDFDGDGDIDVFWTSLTEYTTGWSENLGGGIFGPDNIIDFQFGYSTEGVDVGDLNGDGLPDVVVCMEDYPLAKTIWYENLGGGNFSSEQLLSSPTAAASRSVKIHDLEGDGDLDIIVGQDDLVWYENTGSGFSVEQLIYSSPPDAMEEIEMVDLDNDGISDILFTNMWTIQAIPVLAGGNFGTPVVIDSGNQMNRVHASDLDDDGDLDVMAVFNNHIWIENLGNWTFGSFNTVFTGTLSDVHSGDFDNDGDNDMFNITSSGIKLYWNNLYGGNQVSGKIFIDLDQNGLLGITDVGLANVGVQSTPQSDYTFSYADGNYFMTFSDLPGVYTVAPNNVLTNWGLTTPNANYTVNVTTTFASLNGLDFGYYPQVLQDDINPEIVGGFPRCNDTINYWLDVENVGTTIPSGIIHLELDDSITFLSANALPDSVQGQNVYWSFDSLFYFNNTMINVQVILPDFNSMGDQLISTLNVSTIDGGGVIQNTFSGSLNQVLVCAYDPNDKTVWPRGETAAGYIANTTPDLTYTVRFQNTGNDTAHVVQIVDQLDPNVNWQSLKPLSSSHEMTTFVDQSGEVVFRFDNIMLPDSNVNEAASHGYVRYKVDLNPGLSDGTIIENFANIYFDQNPAVVTNTTLNTIGTLSVSSIEEIGTIKVYPNPTQGQIHLEFSEVHEHIDVQVLGVSGKQVADYHFENGKDFDLKFAGAAGIYFIQITVSNGSSHTVQIHKE